MIVGTVRDIIISDEAQAQNSTGTTTRKRRKISGRFERATGPVDASPGAFGRRPAWGEQPSINCGEWRSSSSRLETCSTSHWSRSAGSTATLHKYRRATPKRPNTAARDAAADITQSVLDDLGEDEEDAGEENAEEALAAKIAAAERRPLPIRVVEEEAPPAEEPVDEWQETVKEQLAKVEEMLKDDRTTSSSRN